MSRWQKILIAIWAIAFVVGVMGVWERIVAGLHPTALGSYVTWGLWISADIYFIGLSAGAFLISSLVYVFQVKKLEPVGKLALFSALLTLFLALLSAWFDIGHMARFYKVFVSPNPRSLMAWIIWLYTAYFLLLLAELRLAIRPDLMRWSTLSDIRGRLSRILLLGWKEMSHKDLELDRSRLRLLGSIGVPLATAFHGGMGALFATLIARPYWFGPLYPIFFLTGALVSGTALLTALTAFFWPVKDEGHRETVAFLGKVLLGLILFDLLLEWAEFSVPAWYGVGKEIDLFEVILFGPYWWVFWISHLFLGTIIPIFLLVRWPKDAKKLGIAGVLVATTYMAVRLNIVIPGFVTPQLRGLEKAYWSPRLTYAYFPSLLEWQVFLFVITLGVALFYLGYRNLPIVQMKEE